MKTCITSVLILATALSATVLSAASSNDTPAAYPTVKVTLHTSRGDDQITLGDTRERVRSLMDCPNQELSRDVWLYHGFSGDSKQANERGCRSMVITFTNDRVAGMQFVNQPAATAIAANLKLGRPARDVASTK